MVSGRCATNIRVIGIRRMAVLNGCVNGALVFEVQMARRFVQHQDAWTFVKRSRQQNALFLPSRQSCSNITNQSIKSHWHIHNFRIYGGLFGTLFHKVEIRVWRKKTNILGERRGIIAAIYEGR